MPSYFSHIYFSNAVTAALPADCRALIYRARRAFEAGVYGPDPLMFLPKYNHLARSAHREPINKNLENLAAAYRRGNDEALGFAAGLFCHLILDAVCHPVILDNVTPERSHPAAEAELDRRLMQKAGIERGFKSPLHTPSDEAVLSAAAAAWPGVTTSGYKIAFLGMKASMDMLTHAAGGRIVRPVYNTLTTKVKALKPLNGAVLGDTAGEENEELSRCLENLIDRAVSPAAELLSRLVRAIRDGEELDFIPAVDFYGKEHINV